GHGRGPGRDHPLRVHPGPRAPGPAPAARGPRARAITQPDPGRTAMTFSVQSEVGQLRQAIVHRPGLELSRLTPQNIGELLFDDVLWAKVAMAEHDVFAQALRDRGVRVHYFGELLAQTLDLPEAREFVLDRVCTPEFLGPALVGPLRGLFDGL